MRYTFFVVPPPTPSVLEVAKIELTYGEDVSSLRFDGNARSGDASKTYVRTVKLYRVARARA